MAAKSNDDGAGGPQAGARERRAPWVAGLVCGLFLGLAPAAGAVTFSNPTPIVIPSSGTATPYPSAIPVTGLAGTTTDVNVTLNNVSHTAIGDVAVVLVPPSGTSILLQSDAGGNNPISGVTVTFDGQAAATLPTTAFPSGSYRPTAGSGTPSFAAPGPGVKYCKPAPATGGTPCSGADALASELNGFTPNGTWNLYVIDRFTGDMGTIAGGWTLDITAGGAPERTLIVNNVGTGTGTLVGTGTVTGTQINCGADCAGAYADGTQVVLTAAPGETSTLASFTGCDTTTATTCTVSINAAKRVTATFNPNPPQTLTVRKAGAGEGIVAGPGIACGADCDEAYNGGTVVVLSAGPSAAGGRFAGFTGCDSVSNNSCTVTLTGAKNVVATFKQGPDPIVPDPPAPTPAAPTPAPAPTQRPAPPPLILPAPAPDTTPPTVTLSGVPSRMSLRTFLKGVKVRVTRNEPSSISATLDAVARRATLIAKFNASLATKSAPRGTGTTTITLKPGKRLVGTARRFRARVRVEVTDAAGNRRTATKTITVTR